MSKQKAINDIITAMIDLLEDFDQSNWAHSLKTANEKFKKDATEGKQDIKLLFGGMGSLNDVVLASGGKYPVEENEKFDALRTSLYKNIK